MTSRSRSCVGRVDVEAEYWEVIVLMVCINNAGLPQDRLKV
jgi:hypothetical protein